MWGKLFLLLISMIATCFALIPVEKTIEMEVIKRFLDVQSETSMITAFLCWNKDDLFRLQMEFYSRNLLSVIHKSNLERFEVLQRENNLLILDISCPNFEKTLAKANKNQLFGHQFRWLIFTNEDSNHAQNIFQPLDIYTDSRVLLAQKTSPSSLTLNYIYKLRKDTDLIFAQFSTWDSSSGLANYERRPISWTRKNFQKASLRTSFVMTDRDSQNHLEDFRFGNVDTQLKVNYNLIQHLREYLNSTLQWTHDRTWGERLGNGSVSGLLGRIVRKEIDISGSPMFCVKERLPYSDCVAMTLPAKGFFIFRQPPLSYVANIFVLPFGTSLWMTNLAFLTICSFLIYAVVGREWKILEKDQVRPDYDQLSPSFWESIMFTIGAVTQQGYTTEPKSGAGKIIIITLFLALLFLFTAYSANTVVLFQSTASSIRTLKDLYDSKMSLGVDDKPYFRFWFKNTFGPIREKIYKERIAPPGKKPHFLRLEEGIQKMRKGYFAFFIDEISGYKIISDTFLEHEKCGLQQIHYLYVSDPMISSVKNSTFREMFYVFYRIVGERGIVNRQLKKLYTAQPQCSTTGSSFRSVGILDLYAVYMLYVFGLVGSLVLLIGEVLAEKLRKSKRFLTK